GGGAGHPPARRRAVGRGRPQPGEARVRARARRGFDPRAAVRNRPGRAEGRGRRRRGGEGRQQVNKLDLVSIAVLGIAGLGLAFRSLTIKIRPGETGVLNAMWTQGLVHRDFGPGYHWDIGPMHRWERFDTTVQTLNMSTGDKREGPLEVKSSDGATVTLDVTVKYRIKPGRAWHVFQVNGPGDAYKLKVRNEARNVLRTELGGLRTEEFYDPRVRQSRAEQMERALSERLALLDVDLIKILIRDLKFDAAFEARIRDKTLAQQDVELNQAKTETA